MAAHGSAGMSPDVDLDAMDDDAQPRTQDYYADEVFKPRAIFKTPPHVPKVFVGAPVQRSRTPAEHATRAHHPLASPANADNAVHHDGIGPPPAIGMPTPAAPPAAPAQTHQEPTLS